MNALTLLLLLASLLAAWFMGMASMISVLRRFYPATFRTLEIEIERNKRAAREAAQEDGKENRA